LCFLTAAFLDGYAFMVTVKTWMICFAGTILMSLFFPPLTDFFSFDSYLYLVPFFVLGCGLYRFQEYVIRNSLVWIAATATALGFIIQQVLWFESNTIIERVSILSMCIGIGGNFLLFRFRKEINWLAWIGNYAYTIYLFHVFAAAGTRIFFWKYGIFNREILFVIGLTAGVLSPIVIEIYFARWKVLRRIFLGLR
jgi:glucan biosynthesis protein C